MLIVQTCLKLERLGTRVWAAARDWGRRAGCAIGWALKQPSVSVATLCPACTRCLSLHHCNWHGNHNDGCSPGVWARGPGRTQSDARCQTERGTDRRLQPGTDKANLALQMSEAVNAPNWSCYVIWAMIKSPDSSLDADMVVHYIRPIELLSLETQIFFFLLFCSRFSSWTINIWEKQTTSCD